MAAADTASSTLVGSVIAPGDAVLKIPKAGVLRVGPGMQQQDEHLVTTKAGTLRVTGGGKLWVEGRAQRYIPAVGDVVLGVVTDRRGEEFAVDVRGPFPAALPLLSFEGATRRNRPNLDRGGMCYARVVEANRDLDPTLSCMDAAGKSSGFGPLVGGYMMDCSTALSRRLLARPPCAVLRALGAKMQFEIAVGQNGRFWINSQSPADTIVVANAIANSEYLSDAQVMVMVSALVERLKEQQAADAA